MLNIGIIGAGHISEYHIKAYKEISSCEVIAISDINEELARERATTYKIPDVYVDYKKLLADKKIDAVVILTPTFTHKDIVIDALNSGKHVLCEKPPALNAEEVQACEDAALRAGKLLMYGLVCRFRASQQHMKMLVESGKFGKIINAEASRVTLFGPSQGWLSNREKGGGVLRDECIHELDSALWVMGYPKPKTVIATESFANSDNAVNFSRGGWKTFHKIECERDVESFIDGYVVLDNGAGMHIKAACIMNAPVTGATVEVIGEKMGARTVPADDGSIGLKLVELKDEVFTESTPELVQNNEFAEMIKRFIDCITNGVPCIYTPGEAVTLLQIIDAMYESARTGNPVFF